MTARLLTSKLLSAIFLVLLVGVFSSHVFSQNGNNVEQKRYLRINFPKPSESFPKGSRITVKGTHNYDISEHIWIILSDGYGFYLQSPEISLYDDGKWEQNNVCLGGGINSIIAVLVNEKGNKEFLKKVENKEWGQFKELPDGSKKLASIKIKNP